MLLIADYGDLLHHRAFNYPLVVTHQEWKDTDSRSFGQKSRRAKMLQWLAPSRARCCVARCHSKRQGLAPASLFAPSYHFLDEKILVGGFFKKKTTIHSVGSWATTWGPYYKSLLTQFRVTWLDAQVVQRSSFNSVQTKLGKNCLDRKIFVLSVVHFS